jgi:hypothetical protein
VHQHRSNAHALRHPAAQFMRIGSQPLLALSYQPAAAARSTDAAPRSNMAARAPCRLEHGPEPKSRRRRLRAGDPIGP